MEPRSAGSRPVFVPRRATLLLSLTLAVGCGSASSEQPHPVAAPDAASCDRTAVAEALNESIGTSVSARNLAEMLPNVRHAWRTSPDSGEAVTDSVVLGRVTKVARDRGFVERARPGTPGRPGAAITTYVDPAASWRTVRVTVAVDEVLAGPSVQSLAIDVGLMGNSTAGEDDSQVECAFTQLGAVAVFSRGQPSRPEFLGIPRQFPDEPFGVAAVDTSGGLTFPFAPGGPGRTSEAFAADVDSVDALRREVRKPKRTVLHDG